VVLPILNQALKTCKKGDVNDSVFVLTSDIKNKQFTVESIGRDVTQKIIFDIIDVKGDEDVSFTIFGNTFVDFIRQFKDNEITCAYEEENNLIKIGNITKTSKFIFPTGTTEEIVPFKFGEDGKKITCKTEQLISVLKKTFFSTSVNLNESPFTAVKLTQENNKLIAESTDKYRISICEKDLDANDNNEDFVLLLPRETAEILPQLLEGIDEVTIVTNKKFIKVEWNNTIFISRLEIDNQNRPFDLLRFKNFPSKVEFKISKNDLLNAIKLSSLVAKDSFLLLKADEKGLLICTSEKNKGAGMDLVVAQEVNFTDDEEETLETKMSCKFFQKAIEVASTAWVKLSFIDFPKVRQHGFVLLIADEEDYKHFLFPVVPNDE
jgi:DNA polymerase III sliding clamp (beta) subunit (PCNA family)